MKYQINSWKFESEHCQLFVCMHSTEGAYHCPEPWLKLQTICIGIWFFMFITYSVNMTSRICFKNLRMSDSGAAMWLQQSLIVATVRVRFLTWVTDFVWNGISVSTYIHLLLKEYVSFNSCTIIVLSNFLLLHKYQWRHNIFVNKPDRVPYLFATQYVKESFTQLQ